ncbi:MAG: hypothetical protein M1827_001378 [Pycnora praestabilis]|nr:MAG: hypothetical protein M1827_001378 [Pycnora praestabilis]
MTMRKIGPYLGVLRRNPTIHVCRFAVPPSSSRSQPNPFDGVVSFRRFVLFFNWYGSRAFEPAASITYKSTNPEDADFMVNRHKSTILADADQEVANGEVLAEDVLPEPGKITHLQFLGKHQDMPFFIVHAGSDLFKSKPNGGRVPREAASRPSLVLENRGESTSSFSTQKTSINAVPLDNIVAQSVEQSESNTLGERAMAIADPLMIPYGDSPLSNTEVSVPPATSSSFGRNYRRPKTPTIFSTGSRGSSSVSSKAGSPPLQRKSASLSRKLPLLRNLNPKQPTPGPAVLTPFVPLALSLVVSFSTKSFLPSCGKRKEVQDLKIDVYFNGEFTASTFVPARYRNGFDKREHLTQTFSGRKVDRMTERAWVIVPSGQNANGTLRESKRSKGAYAGTQERWAQIARALEEEAEYSGRNKYGDRSVVGEYLTSLANLAMPAEVQQMQSRGGPKFGVLDVVITLGKGRKDPSSTPYLKEPERLRVSGCTSVVIEGRMKLAEDNKNLVDRLTAPHGLVPNMSIPSPQRNRLEKSRGSLKSSRKEIVNSISESNRQEAIRTTKPAPNIKRKRKHLSAPEVSGIDFPATMGSSAFVPGLSRRGNAFDLTLVPAGAPLPKLRKMEEATNFRKSPVQPPRTNTMAAPVRPRARPRSRNANGTLMSMTPKQNRASAPSKTFRGSLPTPEEGLASDEGPPPKPTLAEELANVVSAAAEAGITKSFGNVPTSSRTRRGRSMIRTPISSDNGPDKTLVKRNPPTATPQRKLVKPKLNGPSPPDSALGTTFADSSMSTLSITHVPTITSIEAAASEPAPPNSPPQVKAASPGFTSIQAPFQADPGALGSAPLKPQPQLKPKKPKKPQELGNPRHFPTPALSQNSVITYAEPEPWSSGLQQQGRDLIHRQVKTERTGEFEERSVLLGVRYLIG